jgi:acetate kinase
MYCYRARKYVGAYLAVLGGADAVIFTGGIGEGSGEVRARICAGMEWCGLVLDAARNAGARGTEARIGVEGGRIDVLVIPTDEERIIAMDTAACVAGGVR